MPLAYVSAPEGVLNKADQDTLVSRVSSAGLQAERAPIDDAGAQSLVWAYCQEIPAEGCCVGGEQIDPSPLRIAVHTPEGALNADTRKELAARIGGIVDEIVGTFDGRLNHWAMLYEVAEGVVGSEAAGSSHWPVSRRP